MDNLTASHYGATIKRGDIIYANIVVCVSGCQQTTSRPVVVVSNDQANAHSPNVTVVPLTTKEKKPLPTHATVMARTQSTALCENLQTISKSQLGTYVKKCTPQEMDAVNDALACAIGLSDLQMVTLNTCELSDKLLRAETQCDLYKKLHTQMMSRFFKICRMLIFENK